MANKPIFNLSELFLKNVTPQKNLNPLKQLQEMVWQLQKLKNSMGTTQSLLDITSERETKNSLFPAITFLFTFEGMYLSCLNSVIYLLICFGHDLYDPIRKNPYIHSPEEIAEVSVELKFRFLEEHQLKAIVLRDSQFIRNKIAHNEFKCQNGSSIITLNVKKDHKIVEKDYHISSELALLADYSYNIVIQLEALINTLSQQNEVFYKQA